MDEQRLAGADLLPMREIVRKQVRFLPRRRPRATKDHEEGRDSASREMSYGEYRGQGYGSGPADGRRPNCAKRRSCLLRGPSWSLAFFVVKSYLLIQTYSRRMPLARPPRRCVRVIFGPQDGRCFRSFGAGRAGDVYQVNDPAGQLDPLAG